MAIFFSNGAHSTKQTVLHPLIFDDILISIVSSTKLLGVIIDNKLTIYSSLFIHFSSQVDQLRLERSYSNAVFALLRVDLYDRNFSKQNSTMMSLIRQLKT